MSRPKWLNLTEVRRWLSLRCEHCGHRFRWKRDSRHSFGGSRAVYHQACIGFIEWRRSAGERLDILEVAMDIAGIADRDVQTSIELRATTEDERIAGASKAFRVFYDIQRRQRVEEAKTDE